MSNKALHLTGVILPESEPRDFWVADGVVVEGPIAGAETISKRCWVLPGLVDAHCHIGLGVGGEIPKERILQQALTARNAGTLLVRDNGVPSDNWWIEDRPDLPRIIRSGRHIALTKRYLPGLADEVDPQDFVAEVELQCSRGQGWIKFVADWIDRSVGDLAPCWSADVVAAGIKRAHELGVRVTAHTFGEQAVAEIVDAGIDCVEHGVGLTDPVIEKMAANGVGLVPTLCNIENFPMYAAQGEEKFPTYAAHMRDLYERRLDTLGKAREAGVPIYCGTDAGTVVTYDQAPHEVVKLGAVGDADFALGAATWRARPWLNAPCLELGASADFVVYDNDPRADLRVVTHPSCIVLRGVIVAEGGTYC
ncbi:MAG: amidohydrolase family protein [Propionibacteriaceae bacterium]|jgi:imidazolonepropionase-like amidohydrolase|nr:amidohydrolase family protein [Propionibacteriaceae bacterium]